MTVAAAHATTCPCRLAQIAIDQHAYAVLRDCPTFEALTALFTGPPPRKETT
ncbi:MAG TPA: hypothetical protein VF642_12200 [Propionibacteriaceae bacterium]|jgi:hypothetical protein